MKRFYILFLTFSILCAATLAWVPTHAVRSNQREAFAENDTETGRMGADHVIRFLVMGVDRAAGLCDSMFLVTLNEQEKNARILQIPRDTYANYTERDYRKINAALHVLGPTGVKTLLSRAMGVRIDYFVILDLSCLRAVVDAIGGVDVNVPQSMHYTDPEQNLVIEIPQGVHHLDGKGAEHFVRYRSGYVNADLGRLDAQKHFLQAFAKKCSTMTAAQLFQVTCSVLSRLQTDIGIGELTRVLTLLRECDTDEIPMATLSGQAVQGSSGAWYYAVNREGACRMVNEYLCPAIPIAQSEFDPDGLFDRANHADFHKVYIAPEASLPLW